MHSVAAPERCACQKIGHDTLALRTKLETALRAGQWSTTLQAVFESVGVLNAAVGMLVERVNQHTDTLDSITYAMDTATRVMCEHQGKVHDLEPAVDGAKQSTADQFFAAPAPRRRNHSQRRALQGNGGAALRGNVWERHLLLPHR